MNIINSKAQVDAWLEKGNILSYFDTPGLTFCGYSYEKGEYITMPGRRLDKILFLIEGTVQIYGIRDDGSISPINQIQSPAVIGDLEFSNGGVSPLFTETKTPVICISLSTKEYWDKLHCDLRFLHMLLRSYADKLELVTALDTVAATLEKRVLVYMQNVCPSSEIRGIEPALAQLHCSRRQLQRVLKKLCEEKKVEKLGKGRYCLMKITEDERMG